MRRRHFITLVGGAAAWPLSARAQQAPMPMVGYLNPVEAESNTVGRGALLNGLAQIGYVEGRNVAIEYRWAEGRYDRLSSLAEELVRRQVDVIVVVGTPAALPPRQRQTQSRSSLFSVPTR